MPQPSARTLAWGLLRTAGSQTESVCALLLRYGARSRPGDSVVSLDTSVSSIPRKHRAHRGTCGLSYGRFRSEAAVEGGNAVVGAGLNLH